MNTKLLVAPEKHLIGLLISDMLFKVGHAIEQ